MDEKQKARLEAMGIKVRLGTQEEAESLPTIIFSVPKLRTHPDSSATGTTLTVELPRAPWNTKTRKPKNGA